LEIKNLKSEVWNLKIWNLRSEIKKSTVSNLKSKNLKYDKINQIDIIEFQNVVKLKNWMYKIENKVSELEILKIELLNIKILKN